jgi:hypothetical protein
MNLLAFAFGFWNELLYIFSFAFEIKVLVYFELKA